MTSVAMKITVKARVMKSTLLSLSSIIVVRQPGKR